MKTKDALKTEEKSHGLWQKTKYANLVRNASSGKDFARFRSNGKLIWRGLDTDVLSVAAQRLPDKIKEIKEDEHVLLCDGRLSRKPPVNLSARNKSGRLLARPPANSLARRS